MNQFTAIAFRDLDNNYVMARLDPSTKELDFHVITRPSDAPPIDQLPLNKVEVLRVTEIQEDIFEQKLVCRLAADEVQPENITGNFEFATLAEIDSDQFRELMDLLYKRAVELVNVSDAVTT
jgi:hypothetical protein